MMMRSVLSKEESIYQTPLSSASDLPMEVIFMKTVPHIGCNYNLGVYHTIIMQDLT